MKAKSLLLGLLAGSAAAGISTLLTAPASGRDTRQQLKENTILLKEQLLELKSELMAIKESASFASKEGKTAFKAFSNDIKYSISNWKNEILPHQHRLQRELKEIEAALHELETNINK